MDSFWQISKRNNKILTEYVRQLRTFGYDFGRIQVRINDIRSSTRPEILMHKDKFGADENIYAGKVFTLFVSARLITMYFL